MRRSAAFFAIARSALAVSAALLCCTAARAEPLNVVSSGGFASAYQRLVAAWERQPGHDVHSEWGPSMGETRNAIPARLARHEPVDVVIMVGEALDKLTSDGLLVSGSKVLLADSTIACAVPRGAPKPDIRTVEQLRSALLAARSVAWSDSASGEYIERQLLPKLGIAEELRGKGRKIPATPVGEIVARGEADLGCQQRSELLPVAGIEIIGDLPSEVQAITQYAAAVVSSSPRKEEAARFLQFLAAPQNAGVIRDAGLVPRIGYGQ